MEQVKLSQMEYEFVYMVLTNQKTLKFEGIQRVAFNIIKEKVEKARKGEKYEQTNH